MERNTKLIIAGAGLIVAYILYKNWKKKKELAAATQDDGAKGGGGGGGGMTVVPAVPTASANIITRSTAAAAMRKIAINPNQQLANAPVTSTRLAQR